MSPDVMKVAFLAFTAPALTAGGGSATPPAKPARAGPRRPRPPTSAARAGASTGPPPPRTPTPRTAPSTPPGTPPACSPPPGRTTPIAHADEQRRHEPADVDDPDRRALPRSAVEGARVVEADHRAGAAGTDHDHEQRPAAQRGAGQAPGSTADHTSACSADRRQHQVRAAHRVRAANSPEHRAREDAHDHEQRQQGARLPGGHPCPATRYGTPQSRPNTVPQNWVPVCVPEPEPGARLEPRRAQHRAAPPAAALPGRRRGTRRPVAHHHEHREPDEHAQPGRTEERGGPARAVQQRRERHRRQHLPELPHEARELVITGTRRGGNQAVTTERTLMNVSASPVPISTPGGDRERQRGRQREHELTRGHRQRTRRRPAPAPEPVEQQADGHLQRRIDQQLQHYETGQGRGAGLEALGGVQPRHAERRPVHHPDDVGRERGRPDEPHPARRRRRGRRPRLCQR